MKDMVNNMSIRILTDSAADFTKEEYKEYGIEFLPLIVSFGEVDYYDNETLDANEFYQKLVSSNALPKTSQITPFRYEEKLEEMTENGDTVIIITLSSKLSGTYKAACNAALEFKNVYVVDSLSATIGQKLLCKYAAMLVKEGLEADEIVARLNEKKHTIRIFAAVDTLDYLKKGGRVSAAVALAGNILNLKPIVSLVNGEVKMVGKAIGNRRANKAITDLVAATAGIDYKLPIGTVYAGDKDNLVKFISDSSHLFASIEGLEQCLIGPTIGTHVGPGAFGIAYFEK